MMSFKMFSNAPIGFNRFQWILKWCVSKCFQNYLFQILFIIFHRFQWFSNNLFQTDWNKLFEKPLKPMGKFENTLKHIILKTLWNTSFENHWNLWGILKALWNTSFWSHWNLWGNLKALWNTSFWKPLKPMGTVENSLKHIIWKPLKPVGNFENTLKHIIWKPLKPMGNSENTLKHII